MLVHHLPNNYVGRFGIDDKDFDRQVAFMLSPAYGEKARQELFITTKNIDNVIWDKVYYDWDASAALSMVSQKARNILTVGCGFPSLEATLVQNNHAVTAIPLDPIVGELAASRGIKVLESNFEKAFHNLDGTLFDCIIFSEILQHLRDPVDILSRAVALLAPDGELLISIPNFRYAKIFKDQFPYPFFKRWNYSRNLLQMIGKHHLAKWLRSIGIMQIEFQYAVESQRLKKLRSSFGIFNIFLAARLLARGKKTLLSQR